MIGTIVYGLCAATSVLCAMALQRGYRQTDMRLLLWSAICFGFLAASNIVLFIDLVLVGPEIDLSPFRNVLTFLGAMTVLCGLIWGTVWAARLTSNSS